MPLVVVGDGHEKWGVDKIIAALEHNSHILEIIFFRHYSEPFPALNGLELRPKDESMKHHCITGRLQFIPGWIRTTVVLATSPGISKLLLTRLEKLDARFESP